MANAKKVRSAFFCSECGAESTRWAGQCSSCKAWNTLQEAPVSMLEPAAASPLASRRQGYAGSGSGKVEKLGAARAKEAPARIGTTFAEFDRVLGGGLVSGEVVLLGGDPGIGKSTLLLQTLCALSQQGGGALYVSGEESVDQIAMRALRLGLNGENLDALCETELERILDTLDSLRPRIAVIDSIQTIHTSALSSAPGSVAQVRECAAGLARFAKQTGCILVIVGHVTKDGALAGPRVLEHIVDAVLYFEGEPQGAHRIIRSFKNRFGAAQEVGIFAMEEMGLREVPNPSALFLAQHKKPVNGACVFASSEGTRPLLIEIQALVEESHNPNARRLSVGLDTNRLSMLLAVLHKCTGVGCFDQNVFLNATGGVKIAETGWDLAGMLAIVSSIRSSPNPEGLVAFGELGLTGELRPTSKSMERLNEAVKMGFKRVLMPEVSLPTKLPAGVDVRGAASIVDALAILKEWEVEDGGSRASADPGAQKSSPRPRRPSAPGKGGAQGGNGGSKPAGSFRSGHAANAPGAPADDVDLPPDYPESHAQDLGSGEPL
jgi:DNA repair protein RadA/Sms